MKKSKGITLIALVITIIVLLILAGVSISLTLGENGILKKTVEAKNTNLEAEGLEKIQLAVMASYNENGIDTTLLAKNLSKINSLTDLNNNAITENTKIILPKSIILNNCKYYIKEDGIVDIKNSILPDEYQQVEYIESTGSQYIDTLLNASQHPNIIVEIEGNFTKINYFQYLFGGGFYIDLTSNCSWKLIGIIEGNKFAAQNGIAEKEKGIISADTQKHIFRLDTVSSIGRIDENSQVLDNNGVKPINFNYFLFASNNNGKIDQNASFKMNSCKILENNQLIRHYIPCYSITNAINTNENLVSANTKGLYDLVEGKFYTNKGRGDFIAGPEV